MRDAWIGKMFSALSRILPRRKRTVPRFYSPVRRKQKCLRALVFCGAVLIGLTAILLLLGLWQIREIRIDGESVYSEDMIAKAAGISPGDAVTGVDRRRAVRSLLAELPYLTDADISVGLSGVVTIHVTGTRQLYYTVQDGMSYLLTPKLVVQDRSVEESTYRNLGAARVELPRFFSPNVGKALQFRLPNSGSAEESAVKEGVTEAQTDKFGDRETTAASAEVTETSPSAEYLQTSEKQYAYIRTTLAALHASAFAGEISAVDLTDKFDLRLTLNETFEVLLGGANRLEDKLSNAADCYGKKKDSGVRYATIDVSDPAMCIFRETDPTATKPDVATGAQSEEQTTSAGPEAQG